MMLLLIIGALSSLIAVNCQTSKDEDLIQRSIPDVGWEGWECYSGEYSSFTARGDVAKEMCREYTKFVHDLNSSTILENNNRPVNSLGGVVEPIIHGGTKAKPKEFPHMVAVGYDGGSRGKLWKCSGTLVSDQFVLTGAHCFTQDGLGHAIYARVGDLNLMSNHDDAHAQEQIITERIPHYLYKPPSLYHDIGLLKLNKPFKFTEYVLPACLTQSWILFYPTEVEEVIATGWGETKLGDTKGSRDLLKVTLQIVGSRTCNKTYGEGYDTEFNCGIGSTYQTCAVGSNGGTCEGDNGGPLVVPSQKHKPHLYDVFAVRNIGEWCGSPSPSVYTKVFTYIGWLESKIWPKEYNRYYNESLP